MLTQSLDRLVGLDFDEFKTLRTRRVVCRGLDGPRFVISAQGQTARQLPQSASQQAGPGRGAISTGCWRMTAHSIPATKPRVFPSRESRPHQGVQGSRRQAFVDRDEPQDQAKPLSGHRTQVSALIRNSDFDRADEPQFRELAEGSVGRVLVAIDEFVTTVERTESDPPGWQTSSRSLKDTRQWFEVLDVFDVPRGLGPVCYLVEVT